jgi:hypothetical protein
MWSWRVMAHDRIKMSMGVSVTRIQEGQCVICAILMVKMSHWHETFVALESCFDHFESGLDKGMRMTSHLEQVVESLDYDFKRFDLADFIEHIARIQRREIIAKAVAFAPEVSAAWVRGETADYVFYNNNLHPVHRSHSILHELAHILLGHDCHAVDVALLQGVDNQWNTNQPQGRLRVANHPRDDVQEQDAEAFVYCIQQRLVATDRRQALMGRSSSIAPLARWVDGMAFEV